MSYSQQSLPIRSSETELPVFDRASQRLIRDRPSHRYGPAVHRLHRVWAESSASESGSGLRRCRSIIPFDACLYSLKQIVNSLCVGRKDDRHRAGVFCAIKPELNWRINFRQDRFGPGRKRISPFRSKIDSCSGFDRDDIDREEKQYHRDNPDGGIEKGLELFLLG